MNISHNFRCFRYVQYCCILTFGNRTPGYSYGLIKKESCVYLFDPHSRDICGMPLDNGKATLTFHDKNVLPSFIVRLAQSLHAGYQFELTPLETKTVSASLEADTDKNRVMRRTIRTLGRTSRQVDGVVTSSW